MLSLYCVQLTQNFNYKQTKFCPRYRAQSFIQNTCGTVVPDSYKSQNRFWRSKICLARGEVKTLFPLQSLTIELIVKNLEAGRFAQSNTAWKS